MTAGVSVLFGLILGLISLLVVTPLVALVVVVAAAAVAAAAAWLGCEGLVARLVPSQPADPHVHARLFNLVNGLCINAGVPPPDVQVLASGSLNALAAGRNPKRATLVVTQGLLDRLTLIELEGVIARELSQIKSSDILPATVAVALFGVLRPRTAGRKAGGLSGLLAYLRLPLSALAGAGLRLTLDRQRDEFADLSGVALTRYPPALLSATEKMGSLGTAVPDVSPAVAHLWMADPAPAGGTAGSDRVSRLFETHPPLDERIEALREL